MYQVLNLKQGSDEWLDYRKGKITASIVANVIKEQGAFRSQKEQALILKGIKEPHFSKETLERMQKGTEKEAEILEKCKDIFNDKTLHQGRVLEKNETYLCSLDCESDLNSNIYEFKYSSDEYLFVSKYDMPSPKYYAQVQFQLMVKDDAEECIFVVMSKDDLIAYCYVKRDEKYISNMLKKINKFYDDFMFNDEKEIEVSDKIRSLSVELLELNDEISEKLKRIDFIKNELKSYAQEIKSPYVINGVNVYAIERETIDYKRLIDDLKIKIDDKYKKKSSSFGIKL